MTRRVSKTGVAAAATLSLCLSAGASAFEKPDFPRLGGYLIGSPQKYEDPAYQAKMAKLHFSILNVWPGWNGFYSYGVSMNQAVQGIKANNPKTLVFLYMNVNEATTNSDSAWIEQLNLLNSNKWWLYSSGTNGNLVVSTWGPEFRIINTSIHSTTNSSGERFMEWRARWQAQKFAVPNPAVDGFFTDNVFWKPRVDGDWNRDGKSDSQNDATVQTWFRQGFRLYFDTLKQVMPGKYQLGNIADWGDSRAVFPEFDKQLHGGVMEGMIGYNWSSETNGGWHEMMRQYRKMMAALAEPKLAIFHQDGRLDDYQGFRYGFASSLMDDAYFYYSTGDKYYDVNWFDEYDVKLGKALSSPPTSAWQNGVYRRDFENGIALVNPKGNGTRTVQLEGSFRKISGKQAPSVNNGQTVTSVTLNDRDGIILLRTQPKSKPKPPTLVVQ